MQSRFTRPKESTGGASPNLYVANCGPKVGVSYDDIQSVFAIFGDVVGVHAADETGARVIVCFSEVSSAQRALRALNGYPCRELGGRTLHIRYSVLHPAAKSSRFQEFTWFMISSLLSKSRNFLMQWILGLGKIFQREECSTMAMNSYMSNHFTSSFPPSNPWKHLSSL